MNYGEIKFEHVWAFQIKCMIANQYDRLIEAIAQNDTDLIIAVCLRLGWNDAFKHVSENIDDYNLSMWISLDDGVFIKVTTDNADELIRYLYERFPY